MSCDRIVGAGQRRAERDEGFEAGRWVEPAVSYIDPPRRFCGYCGRPIARRYWQGEDGERRQVFCGPEHAARTTYPLRLVHER